MPAPTPAIQEVEAVEVVEGVELELEVEQEMEQPQPLETSSCLPIAGAQSSGAFPLVINNGKCLCIATSCQRLQPYGRIRMEKKDICQASACAVEGRSTGVQGKDDA